MRPFKKKLNRKKKEKEKGFLQLFFFTKLTIQSQKNKFSNAFAP